MTRLCGEIVALRGARLTFVRDLGQDVAAMKADFRRAHFEMARRTKAERQGFVRVLGHEVASLMAGFHRAHKAMARQTKAERRAAVNHLKKTVGGMRREFALDLAGAHRAWFGPIAGGTPGQGRGRTPGQGRGGTSVKEAAERDRMAALAMAKEEAVRHHAAQPPAKEGPGVREKEEAEILKFLVIQTDDPSTTRGARNDATGSLWQGNGGSYLLLLPRPRQRPLWDHVLALHLLRLRRQGRGAGAGVSSALRPLPGHRGHQDLHLHRLPRHRLCAVDPRPTAGLS